MAEAIDQVQKEIIDEFSMLDNDMEMTISYIMELGEGLPEMEESKRTEDNIVKGCQSKVWLDAQFKDDKIEFSADSNTAITKGLVSLLVRILSGQKAQDIVSADLFFIDKIGLNRFIGTQRSNGLGAMIKRMKIYGLAYSSK